MKGSYLIMSSMEGHHKCVCFNYTSHQFANYFIYWNWPSDEDFGT